MIRGDVAAVAASLFWALASVLYTREGRITRPSMMNLVKCVLGFALFLFLLPLAAWARPGSASWNGSALRPSLLALVFFSGFVGISLGDTFYFVSLKRIGVRRTMTLGLLAPLMTAALAWGLGQPLPGIVGFGGIGLTLAGVFLVIRASAAGEGPARVRFTAVIFGVLSALCQAVGIVTTKDVFATLGVLPVCTLRLAAGILGLLFVEVFRSSRPALATEFLRGMRRMPLLLAAFLGTFLGFLLFQWSIALESPPVTAALVSTSPLFAAPLAAHFLKERLSWEAAAGTVIAVGGVALLMFG